MQRKRDDQVNVNEHAADCRSFFGALRGSQDTSRETASLCTCPRHESPPGPSGPPEQNLAHVVNLGQHQLLSRQMFLPVRGLLRLLLCRARPQVAVTPGATAPQLPTPPAESECARQFN